MNNEKSDLLLTNRSFLCGRVPVGSARVGGWVIAWVVLSAALAPGRPLRAQPMVRVRAQTRIDVDLRRGNEGLGLRGTLLDDVGGGLPARTIHLEILDERRQRFGVRVPTDELGGFYHPLPRPFERLEVSARFAGDAGHIAAEVTRILDGTRAQVQLTLSREDGGNLSELDLDRDARPVRLVARSSAGGQQLRFVVRNELDEEVFAGTTGASGQRSWMLATSRLGLPGLGRLTVESVGDSERAPARQEYVVVRFRRPTLRLAGERDARGAAARIRVEGALRDSQGGLARRAVGLFLADTHVTTVLTDEEGRFERSFEWPVGLSRAVVGARFQSDAPWRPGVRSEPVVLEATPSPGFPWWWLLVPGALAAVIWLWSIRRGPGWTSHAGRVSRGPPRPPRRGIERGRPLQRPATRFEVGGLVRDLDTDQAIGAARIVLRRRNDPPTETRSRPDGTFRLESVPAGQWELSVEAEGYGPSTSTLEIPHRGGWSAMQVSLRSLREEVIARYAPVAERLRPNDRAWAFWTPRELAKFAPHGRFPAVGAATDVLEKLAYGPGGPTPGEVDSFAERTGALARELEEDDALDA